MSLEPAKVFNRDAVRQLSDQQVLELHHRGLLEFAHTLLLSIQQVQRLIRQHQLARRHPQRFSGHAPQDFRPTPARSADLITEFDLFKKKARNVVKNPRS